MQYGVDLLTVYDNSIYKLFVGKYDFYQKHLFSLWTASGSLVLHEIHANP